MRYENLLHSTPHIHEPALIYIGTALPNRPAGSIPHAFIFSQIPHWRDPFNGLKEHQNTIRDALWSLIRLKYIEQIRRQVPPVISIHIRRGDFRELSANEDFTKVGSVRTPLHYFRTIIHQFHEICSPIIPITIFTDGTEQELSELLALPNVKISPRQPAIVDLMLMARSKVIVSSAGSTFSQWAGFLSEAAFIHHPDHFHTPNRSNHLNAKYYEGTLTGTPQQRNALLMETLTHIIME